MTTAVKTTSRSATTTTPQPASKPATRTYHGFRIRIVGATFIDDYPDNLHWLATQHSTRHPLKATLHRAPDNPYDTNAIEVHINGEQIGHIPRDIAAQLATIIDNGTDVRAELNAILINPDHPDRPGATVNVYIAQS